MAGKQESLLAAPLAGLTRAVTGRPWLAIGLSLLAAAACAVWAVARMEFRTSRLDLLNPRSTYNQRWLAYLDQFGDQDDLAIIVEADEPSDVPRIVDDLAERLSSRTDQFRLVLQRIDLTHFREKALHYLPLAELRALHARLTTLAPVWNGDWTELTLERQLANLARSGAASDPRDSATMIAVLADALQGRPLNDSPWSRQFQELGKLRDRFGVAYFTSNQGRRAVVLCRLANQTRGSAISIAAINELRSLLDQLRADYPQATIGLTGMPILEADEMQASQRDSILSSLLSLVGVAVVFVAGFGGVRRPLLAVATLLVGIAWTFGFITLAVGHLNLLSVAFGMILIGLGIDFGIHVVARYQNLRETDGDSRAALIETARSVGPGIVTGGVTTAVAFLSAALTQFTGIAELGIVTAGGIVLCLLATFLVLPPLILLNDRRHAGVLAHEPLLFDRLPRWLSLYPRGVLCASVCVTSLCGAGIPYLTFDHNLLNLQPRGLESVEWEQKLAHSPDDRGVWFAVSICSSREEVLARREQFLKLPEVTAVDEIASLLPAEQPDRHQLIADLQQALSRLPAQVPTLPVIDQARLLSMLPGLASANANIGDGAADGEPAAGDLARLAVLVRELPPTQFVARVARLQQQSAAELLTFCHLLREMANPESPRRADVPEVLAARFFGRDGGWLLRVHGRPGLWETETLAQFVQAVERIDPRVTGHPVQTYYASRQMQQSYLHAAVYSSLAVLIVLVIDFRSLLHTFLSVIPMLLGLVQLCGLLGWLSIPLNPANMIVLPLILGIGIDDGVHVVHDYLATRRRYRMLSSTATAVVITSATTMIGFGSMMIAHHQGLRSLGQVLTLGVFLCLVSSLTTLPVLLSMRRWRRRL